MDIKYLKEYQKYRALMLYHQHRTTAADQDSFNKCAAVLQSVDSAIDSLENPTDQHLLRLRYVEGFSWTKVGFLLHYSPSSVKRIHRRALKRFEDVNI